MLKGAASIRMPTQQILAAFSAKPAALTREWLHSSHSEIVVVLLGELFLSKFVTDWRCNPFTAGPASVKSGAEDNLYRLVNLPLSTFAAPKPSSRGEHVMSKCLTVCFSYGHLRHRA